MLEFLKRKLIDGSLIRGSVAALSMKLLGAVAGLVLNIVLARELGANGAGLFYMSLSVVTAFVMISRFGVDIGAVRYLAPFASSNKNYDVFNISFCALIVIIIIGIFSTITGVKLSGFISNNLYSVARLESVITMMAIAIIPMALVFMFSQVFRACGKTLVSQFVLLVLPNSILLILICGSLKIFGNDFNVEEVGYFYVIAISFAALISTFIWLRYYSFRPQYVEFKRHISNLLSSSHRFLLGMLAEYSMAWLPIVIVGAFLGSTDVGMFSIALRLSVLVSFIVAPIAVVIGPKIAVFYKENKIGKAEELISSTNRFLLIVSIPIVVSILLSAEFILTLFGDEFVGVKLAFIIMAIGEVVQMATGNSILFLNMTKFEREARNYRLVGVALMVLFCFLLVPHWGLLGAACSVVTGQIVKNLLAFYFIKKEFKFWAI